MNLLQIHEPGQTPLPHEQSAAVGIDLGTTYSVIAVASENGSEVIRNIHGHALIPSVVYYSDNGEIEVGFPARLRYERGEKGAIASIKRLMGRGATDIKSFLGNLSYDLAPTGQGIVRLRAGGREVTPVEISAEILKTLKKNAEQSLGREVKNAVITVPAYFDDAARAATKDAARLAGLEVLRLINEPTAAALAYGLDQSAEGIYAMYDLGGGTFDFSLLKLEKGVFQVLATAGDTSLGGDDFDDAIAAWVLSESGQTGTDLPTGEIAQLVSEARRAKHILAQQLSTPVSYKGKTLELTRDIFDDLILDYIEKTLTICEQALLDAKLSIGDVKGVVMVGGSTRVKLVVDKASRYFEKPVLCDIDPDKIVAIGAALQAKALTQGSDTLLLDVIPLSLGLETMGGLCEKIIERNTPIPVSVTQEFTTWQDNQTGMKVHVVQGEREMAEHNRSLAQFELAGIPPLVAGIARVKVSFTVDADGLLTVSAEEKTTGTQQTIAVKPSYGLPTEEIERMLVESMENARADIMGRLLAEARVEAERSIIELQSAIKQDGDLLDKAERAQFENQIRALKNASQGEDRDYIDAEMHELGKLSQNFAERRMDRAVGKALKGANVNEMDVHDG